MISFQLKSTRVSCHPLFLVLIGLCALGGGSIFPALLALFTHETGHLLCACLLRFHINFIEITPFGGLIEIDGLETSKRIKRFLIALCGPLFSLLGCMAAILLYKNGCIAFDHAQEYLRAGLVLFFINLLPALPLDGGHMLRAALGGIWDEKKLSSVLLLAAKLFAAGLCGLSLAYAIKGQLKLLPFMAGIYLFYAASRESKSSSMRYISQLIARRLSLDKNDVLRVQLLAASENAPVISLLSHLTPQKLHIVYVLSRDGMNIRGTLCEDKICSALIDNAEQTLSDLVQHDKENGCVE